MDYGCGERAVGRLECQAVELSFIQEPRGNHSGFGARKFNHALGSFGRSYLGQVGRSREN